MNQKVSSINLFNDSLLKMFIEYNKTQKPISVNFRELVPEIVNMDRYTHFIHSYPAKLLQQIPYYFLRNDILSREGDYVLDPFCGTGTVLLEASLSNRNAIGVDVNPLAVLISKSKTSKVNVDELEKELISIEEKFIIYKSSKQRFSIPKISNIEHWYNKRNIRKLIKIKFIVSQIRNEEVKDFFNIVFSICCKKFSYSDPRISVPVKLNQEKFEDSHSLKEAVINQIRFINKGRVFEFFLEQAKKNIERLKRYQLKRNPDISVKVYNQDIKIIDNSIINDSSIQLILTSPPYVSAQKYIRASSLSLQWLELSEKKIAELDKESVGREHFPKKEYEKLHLINIESVDEMLKKIYERNKLRAYITYKYLKEMEKSFKHFFRVLKNNGFFVMVIGNNTISGYEFMTYKYLIKIAERIGFNTELVLIDDIKSRGLMTKRNKTASMISREYIVIFKKV
ncbi:MULTISPECIES: TRM11 family SAM-dependent methyltransferase [Aliarcobacter]|uniref:Methyltransferase n=1 Tax=Aliarcobacter cibarius TaxID=255507 RepID=A0ABY2V2B7_9BACT|nr:MULTISPECIES: DNA methyltransferase [Aliarcobacter]MDK2047853.1 DNA methyltransferase [Aliarcobacter butzleri]TLS96821.1 site-specific DNA-methyltransferase [Aliarcobacter cibarius]TLS97326.1 site-specific DNA-methyltransferase [Aliarcobacter cibarius]